MVEVSPVEGDETVPVDEFMTASGHDTGPIRGSLRLSVRASSPNIQAGSDFSIFVLIQNPFDVPITVYQVKTHIPVELIDVNRLRIEEAAAEDSGMELNFWSRIMSGLWRRRRLLRRHTGAAIAVGTEFDPRTAESFVSQQMNIQSIGEGATFTALSFTFPENPRTEELDAIFRRMFDYQRGVIPVTLQPGDSVVKQFVLRTRHWLLFTPITHNFEIQVNYSSDSVDHTDTVEYGQSIRSTIGAMAVGAVLGAAFGTLLRSLSTPSPTSAGEFAQVSVASAIASIAVVVAFSRKSSAQPLVSVEDFWGGALIGFSIGFFGFERFESLFAIGA